MITNKSDMIKYGEQSFNQFQVLEDTNIKTEDDDPKAPNTYKPIQQVQVSDAVQIA